MTIPQEIRDRLGLLPHTEVEFEIDGDALRKARGGSRRGRELVARMRGRGDTRLTTDDILALTRG